MTGTLPVFIVTGFLGSGKTTLISRLLDEETDAGTGILVNEFGEVALDHRLLVHRKDHLELIDGGCMCCARRSDIAAAIHELVTRSRRNPDGAMRRVLIETSGLANPAPIISMLGKDPWMRSNTRLGGVKCVVDAVNIAGTLESRQEAVNQIALADTVIVTKRDLPGALDLSRVTELVRAVAPDVNVIDGQGSIAQLRSALLAEAEPASVPQIPRAHVAMEHASGWTSFVLPVPQTVDWPIFSLWLSSLLHAHGQRIVRVKGLIRTFDSPEPLLIHGVQHVVYPPKHLSAQVDDGKTGYLVFITDGISNGDIEGSLHRFGAMVHAA